MEHIKSLLTFIEENLLSNPKSTTLILGSAVGFILVSQWIRSYIKQRSYFKQINVNAPTPYPVFGNLLEVLRDGLLPSDINLVTKYGKICGRFEATIPIIMTTDVKFIKTFLIKDFNSFVNRRVIFFQKIYLYLSSYSSNNNIIIIEIQSVSN